MIDSILEERMGFTSSKKVEKSIQCKQGDMGNSKDKDYTCPFDLDDDNWKLKIFEIWK